MQYITVKDDIAVLPLSVRLSNCLRRTGIHTIGAMMEYPKTHDWFSISNMGAKSVSEVSSWIERLEHGDGEYILVSEETKGLQLPPKKEPSIIDQDISLTALDLPTRALNHFQHERISFVSELLLLPDRKILSVQGLGERTCKDVFAKVSQVVDKALTAYLTSEELVSEKQRLPLAVTADMVAHLNGDSRCCLREAVFVRKNYPEAVGETFYYRLYSAPYIQSLLKAKVLLVLESNSDGVSRKSLSDQLPNHLGNTTIVEELLIELEAADMVICGEVMLKRKYPSVLAYVKRLEDEKLRGMLYGRLMGKTLEELGQEHNLTRERIRQLINKQVSKFHQQRLRFNEDQYLPLYDQYDISIEEFVTVTEEPASTYHYLDMISSIPRNEKKPLIHILEDESFPAYLRKQCERVIYKDYITLGGTRVKKTRPEMCYYYVRNNCLEITDFDDFMQRYHEWLEELGLREDDSLVIEGRAYENKLNSADYVLWNQWRRFRYYNIAAHDYELLFATLYLEQYENVELSTLKFFNDYPELMEEYDIRDEYELHNLLKKIWNDRDDRVSFRRMPTIEIGEPNRDNQVLEILLQYAPISGEELAIKYEEAYGTKAATVLGGYLHEFDEYYHNGMYSIDADNLPYEHTQRMRKVLTNDYYTIANVKSIYQREFADVDVTQINPYTLKTLGFRVYEGYVVKDTYGSAVEYVHHLLFDKDIVDARQFDKSIFYLGIYSSELGKLRMNRQIVEFAPYRYINIRRLQQFGVTHDAIQAFCDDVHRYVEPGEIFSINSLRERGFEHELFDLGFEEWFYGSLVMEDREHFSYQKIGGSRLLMAGKGKNLIAILLTRIVCEQSRIDFYDLWDKLTEEYGLRIPRDKLMEAIHEADLYYDRIMEAVYIDYETYFEEV